MLKKKERISRKKFNEIFITSKIILRGSFFVVRKAPDSAENSGQFMASIVISKKIAKKATDRNYLKRALYNLVSQYKKSNPLLNGVYIFIYQKKPTKFIDLQNDFQKAFH